MLPKDEQLPAKKKVTLHSVLNYPQIGVFQVVYRHSLLDPYVEIVSVALPNIRQALAKDVIIHATMEVDDLLRGHFHIYDPFTKGKASMEFDARVSLQQEQCLLIAGGKETVLIDNDTLEKSRV